jgi:hypothetical protein
MMNKNRYINDVIRNISTDKKTIERIKEDLLLRIEEAEEKDPFFDVVTEIGTPKEVAKEFMDNLDIPVKFPVIIGFSYSLKFYEFTSKTKVFGIPLVHVNIGGRYQTRVAKGIIAIGDISLGLVSIGGISVGLISVGGLSVGIAALGGIAAGYLAIGAIAFGSVAIGAIAFGISKAIGEIVTLMK